MSKEKYQQLLIEDNSLNTEDLFADLLQILQGWLGCNTVHKRKALTILKIQIIQYSNQNAQRYWYP